MFLVLLYMRLDFYIYPCEPGWGVYRTIGVNIGSWVSVLRACALLFPFAFFKLVVSFVCATVVGGNGCMRWMWEYRVQELGLKCLIPLYNKGFLVRPIRVRILGYCSWLAVPTGSHVAAARHTSLLERGAVVPSRWWHEQVLTRRSRPSILVYLLRPVRITERDKQDIIFWLYKPDIVSRKLLDMCSAWYFCLTIMIVSPASLRC